MDQQRSAPRVRRARRYWLVVFITIALVSSVIGVVFITPHRALASAVWVLFAHTATTANSAANSTMLTEAPDLDASDILIVSAAYNRNNTCGCQLDPHPLGVWWTGRYWAIYHEDGATITPGATYNISLIAAANASEAHFSVQTATSSNTLGNWMTIDDPNANYNPNAIVLVTANLNNNGTCGCVNDSHPLGVWYTGGRWAIFHEDRTPIPIGATYNIQVLPTYTYSQQATGSYYVDDLNNPAMTGHRELLLFVTPNWNANGNCGCQYDTHQLGVYYDPWIAEWSVFHEDLTSMIVGEQFNYMAVGCAPSSCICTPTIC